MCFECRQNPCHPRCSNAEEPKIDHYCSICGYGIYKGEEYIENDDCKYAHLECVDYVRDLARFLGYEIKEMKNVDD